MNNKSNNRKSQVSSQSTSKNRQTENSSEDPTSKNSGYVRLYRSMRYDPLWKKERKFSQFEAWIDLYMEASGTNRMITYRKKGFELKRGQLIFSERRLAERWQWTRGSVENFLHKLVIRQTITTKTIKVRPQGTLITILKYSSLNPGKDTSEELF